MCVQREILKPVQRKVIVTNSVTKGLLPSAHLMPTLDNVCKTLHSTWLDVELDRADDRA
jgi:hypothetical protein